ncbi:preprotein translocase subunit YajC [Anaerococcus urinomassiliensis]|uniref:preprotein translocase subunit YajC n=1 Tax=Anaerococcus urinomassiliensis TaxID=1745712 RepID=UPI00093F62A5|nr:preprotein translocase subunit YajC [Anaerococcus urinomassiliensis]
MLDNIGQISLVLLAFLSVFFVIMQIISAKNMKKSRENMRILQESLKPGVKVMLLGGIYGTLVKLNKETAIVKIAENVEIKVDRSSIQSVIK